MQTFGGQGRNRFSDSSNRSTTECYLYFKDVYEVGIARQMLLPLPDILHVEVFNKESEQQLHFHTDENRNLKSKLSIN